MSNYIEISNSFYTTPIGHTVAALPPKRKVSRGYGRTYTNKDTFKVKASAIIAWFDDMRGKWAQYAIQKIGKDFINYRELISDKQEGLSELLLNGNIAFDDWELTYIPNMFREAKRLIDNTIYMKIRLYARDRDVSLRSIYDEKGLNYNFVRRQEQKEEKIVFWALEYFEKIYGGQQ